MKALFRFILFGGLLFAVVGVRVRHTRPAADGAAISDDEKLLAAAIVRGLGDDDIVVQRRLLENARQVALEPSADAARLGEGDPIIERRLVQQMRLQLESEARRAEPTDAELRDYLDNNADRFAVPVRVRVEQIFFSTARRGKGAEVDAQDALRRLGTTRDAEVEGLSDPGMWPAQLPLQSARELERILGTDAFNIVAVPVGEWTGPYRSLLGYHLVRVLERVPATMPPFETVRAAVRLALLNDRAEAHIERTLQ